MCDSTGLKFRQSSNVPECIPESHKFHNDTVLYEIKIEKFTAYKHGNGLCAQGSFSMLW